MNSEIPPHVTDGSAAPTTDPTASTPRATGRHLRSVATGADTHPIDRERDEQLAMLQRHLDIAEQLGVSPLTVVERAASLLEPTCDGWRRRRHCAGTDGVALDRPHEACALAQYHHDLLLLEHGLMPSPPRSTRPRIKARTTARVSVVELGAHLDPHPAEPTDEPRKQRAT